MKTVDIKKETISHLSDKCPDRLWQVDREISDQITIEIVRNLNSTFRIDGFVFIGSTAFGSITVPIIRPIETIALRYELGLSGVSTR